MSTHFASCRWTALLLGVFLLPRLAQAEPPRIPVIVDTDIGTDIDDAFALGLVLASPELDLQAVTTVGQKSEDRAWLVCRFLTQCGRAGIPVAAGADPQPDTKIDGQIQYRNHPAAIFNRTLKPVKEPAAELLYQRLKENPGKITIIAIGPLTNIGRLLKDHPDAAGWIKRLVIMGGSIRVGYEGNKPEPEWNIKLDVAAARTVLSAGVPITLVPLDATVSVKLTFEQREQLFGSQRPIAWQVHNLYELWDKETPTLFDPVAVACAFDQSFCKFEELHLSIDDDGLTRTSDGKPNARVATSVDDARLLKFIIHRFTSSGEPILPQPPKNRTKLIEPGGFPSRVHVAENYDTDIQKRWWMSGKAETRDLPEGARRACRAVLTQDFDDKMGQTKTMYRAVIFNPVPGPPMGKRTRLSFRYKLRGTDTMRIQLYSLTNGYHRYLSVDGLVQDEWRQGAVDMTAMRRPDGSGGPLSEDERIDDIQFYVDPRAELLIDDIVLYDAAADGERRPFPKRILFTGWFDTGKQGQEWPGTFEIAPHEKPLTWKFARSVQNEELGRPWIKLSLRGDLRLSENIELSFRYRFTGDGGVSVELYRQGKPISAGAAEVKEPRRGEWTNATLAFRFPETAIRDQFVDEVRFLVAPKSELRLDDVLLYEK